ncbi:MAG: lantibiotic dehydratase, partial [Acidobacteriota bacterium]
MSAPTQTRPAPVLVRVAGLPVETLRAFSSDLPDRLDALDALHARLDGARKEAVDDLFDAVGDDACGAIRPALLAAKRACFNGRPLAPLARRPEWPEVSGRVSPGLGRILDLEKRLEEETAAFDRSLEEQARGEADALAALTEHSIFRTGLSIASPVVGRESHRLRRKPARGYGRRERRLASTLLRYASRAAFKISPFSTLTSLTLGGLAPVDADSGLQLELGDAPLLSLARLRRHLWDRCLELLHRHPAVRRAARLAINDSVTPLDDGRSCYLRPSGWTVDLERLAIRFHEESWVKLDLRVPELREIASLLPDSPTYGGLVDALSERGRGAEGEGGAERRVDRLLDIGWLVFEHPWPTNTGHLEARCLEDFQA